MFSMHHWATPKVHFPPELTFQEMIFFFLSNFKHKAPSTAIHIPTKKTILDLPNDCFMNLCSHLKQISILTAYSRAFLIWFKSNTCSQYVQSNLTSASRILGRVGYRNILCLGKLGIQSPFYPHSNVLHTTLSR